MQKLPQNNKLKKIKPRNNNPKNNGRVNLNTINNKINNLSQKLVPNSNQISLSFKQRNEMEDVLLRANTEKLEDSFKIETMSDYLHAVLHPKTTGNSRLPLYFGGPTYQKRFDISKNYPVNAVGAFHMITVPAQLAQFDKISTSSMFLYTSAASTWDPTTGVSTIADVDVRAEIGIANTLSLDSTITDNCYLSSFGMEIKLTSTSLQDRKGTLFIAEDREEAGLRATSSAAGSGSLLTAELNKYYVTNMSRCDHYREMDLTPQDACVRYTYIYPNSYSSAALVYTPATNNTSTQVTTVGSVFKKIAIAATGLPVGSTINIRYFGSVQMEPLITVKDIYNTSFNQCYINPDPFLRYIEQIRSVVLKEGNDDEHHDILPKILGPNSYSKPVTLLRRRKDFGSGK